MSYRQLRKSPQVMRDLLILGLLLGLPAAGVQDAAGSAPLALEKTIVLPGVKGRIDHMAVDAAGQRLFVAALGNNTVEVIDLAAGQRLHSLDGLQEPQDVLYLPEFNKIFVSSAGDGTVKIFEGTSFRLLNTLKFSGDADNLRYDPKTKLVYVGYGAGALGLIDAPTGRRRGDVRLAGHPESFQLEQAGPKIYVNVPTAGHLAVVDRQTLAVLAKWPLKEARQNFPLALDEAGQRLFIGCRTPARILVYATGTGKAVARLESAGDADDLFFDPKAKRLYASCGAGVLEVFQQTDPDHYAAVVHLPTAKGARTCLYVPELSRLYLAVPSRAGQPAAIWVYTVGP